MNTVNWNALSLCDGMSCGQIALRELGIIPRKYYASEIDKHAIGQTQLNFPDTIQLGDMTKWREWDIGWANIQLLMAGTPCQGFSFAGKQLAFDDPRSALFFTFIDILNHTRKFNPDVIFLLENVNMKKSHMAVINEYCGLHGVRINSSLVSAQMRDRWYWSNVRTRQEGLFDEVYTDIPQPEDRGIFLRDILEPEVDERYYLSEKATKFITNAQRLKKRFTAINGDKSLPLMTRSIEGWQGTYIAQRPRGKNNGGIHTEKAPTLSANAWEQNNMVIQPNPSKESGGKQPYQQNRVYDPSGKSPALCAEMSCGSHAVEIIPGTWRTHNDGKGFRPLKSGKAGACTARAREDGSGQNAVKIGSRIRRLTPTECARLQTIPEWYVWGKNKDGWKKQLLEAAFDILGPFEGIDKYEYVGSSRKAGSEQVWTSKTQQYKMLGNGWTVEVIKHILSFLPAKYLPKTQNKQ